MKKAIAIILALISVFSCCILVFAGDGGESGESNVTVNVDIDAVDHDLWYCEFCGTPCGSKDAMAAHYATCEAYQIATHTSDETNVCEYCGETFSSEAALNTHMEIYNHSSNHIRECTYTDHSWAREHGLPEFFWDYNDGGCGMTFVKQDELARHQEQCSHKGDYTTWKKIKLKVIELIEKGIDLLKGVDWGSVLNKVVDLVKKVPWSDLFDKVGGAVGDIDLGGLTA